MSAELEWAEHGPRSLRYGDIYFSEIDGLAESRAVFLQGCDLPQAWARRTRFTVAELGFGAGLNIAALLDLWQRERPAGARLSIFSVEAHLLAREDAARALAIWPDLAESAAALVAAWPDARRGFHRLDFPDHAATLDLYVGEVGEGLARWSGPADAWFLDGFAPSKNPQMWRDEVLAAVARLSAPGARLASFTVAGHVRRGLAAAGFEVSKRPGFGAKLERLVAQLSPAEDRAPPPRQAPGRVAILGAGIAGASLARSLARQGVACTVVEAIGAGAGASGNPAALVTPRLDAGFGPAAELHAQAFAYAVDVYRHETPAAVIAEGALQLGAVAGAAERFDRLAAWEGFRPRSLVRLEAVDLARRLAEPTDPDAVALRFADALVIEPAPVLQAWLADATMVFGDIVRLERIDGRWLGFDQSGEARVEAETICLAAGFGVASLVASSGLRAVRGQAEFTSAPIFQGEPGAWSAYAIPLRDSGVLFGASHLRGDEGVELRPREAVANLEALAARRPALAARVRALTPGQLQSRAALRAATPDHLPLAGAIAQTGLHVLGGLGGRGFTLAPLLAEHVVAGVLGAPSPLSRDLPRRMRPDRFTPENRERARPLGDRARS